MALSALEPPEKFTFEFFEGLSVNWADKMLTETSQEVAKTQAAFESRIALAERQHQLHESKIMKRLTELAFIFIPLSLSTSIFGMEMKEFEDGIPLYVWVATSAGLLLAAYAIRWFLGSRLWRIVRENWISNVVVIYPKYRGDESNIPHIRLHHRYAIMATLCAITTIYPQRSFNCNVSFKKLLVSERA
ncbi:hypothetical protein QBC38DRAFT_457484 [Podospora fimiseda]|uniref:Uncharacterized protein n=1 Tax=Podospora fimiseda TaxID=252190 RepID=A0AAN7BL34_9PEZI|nr:hypothetical protein QBC38DRAFT_457484 [Podospora fimiseda]